MLKESVRGVFFISIKVFLNVLHIALSWNAPQVRLYKYFKDLPEGQPVVVAVGAMAKGPDTFADEYTDEKIGIKDTEKEKEKEKLGLTL